MLEQLLGDERFSSGSKAFLNLRVSRFKFSNETAPSHCPRQGGDTYGVNLRTANYSLNVLGLRMISIEISQTMAGGRTRGMGKIG